MKPHRPSLIQRFVIFCLMLYVLGLIVYLSLRLIFADRFWWLALAHTFALYLFVPLFLVLPLAWRLQARRVTGMALVLGVVGAAWFLPPMLPKTISTTSDTPFKIVTFNVLGFEGNDLQREVDWLLTTDADMLVLQEVFVSGEDPRLVRLLAKYPHEARTSASVRIFSRLPFVEKDLIWIETVPRRTSLRVVMNHQGQDVTVYGVHLSQPRTDEPHFRLPRRLRIYPLPLMSRYDETRRNAQIDRILAMVAQEKNPVIVTGDFNMTPTSLTYDRIATHLKDAYAEAGSGWGMTYPVSRVIDLPAWLPPLLRIDYVWHSPQWQTVSYQRGEAQNSDHFPVMVSLALR